jgi:hypothetical protein
VPLFKEYVIFGLVTGKVYVNVPAFALLPDVAAFPLTVKKLAATPVRVKLVSAVSVILAV